MVAVDNSLLRFVIDIFIKKKAIPYNRQLQNLIKYLRPPIVIGSFQISDPRLLRQSGGIIRAINANSDIDLASKTKLKIVLSNNKSHFPYININGDKFEVNFTATYTRSQNKQKVLDHIKMLIASGDKIEIYDKYLFHDNGDAFNIDRNHHSVDIINQITSILNNHTVKIYCKNRGNIRNNENTRINDRKNNITYSNITLYHRDLNKHDRYIKIFKNNRTIYEIILSSGIYNILGNSDFTYVVRIL